jgi:hypothetical protein
VSGVAATSPVSVAISTSPPNGNDVSALNGGCAPSGGGSAIMKFAWYAAQSSAARVGRSTWRTSTLDRARAYPSLSVFTSACSAPALGPFATPDHGPRTRAGPHPKSMSARSGWATR